MPVTNRSFTTIEYATDFLSSMYTDISQWTNLTVDQKLMQLNMAALQLETGFCLPSIFRQWILDGDDDKIPEELQMANSILVLENMVGILGTLVRTAKMIQIDVLRIQRDSGMLGVIPFSELVTGLMAQIGFEYCGRGNVSNRNVGQVG